MKARIVFACVAAICLALTASAQDLKPVKDRVSKKFGYQDKSKNWVIEPSFDAAKRFIDGYAIVEVQGLEGMIDQSGAWVLKPDYNSIGKFDKLGLCELMNKYDHTRYYGLADRSGRRVSSSPAAMQTRTATAPPPSGASTTWTEARYSPRSSALPRRSTTAKP